MIERLNAAFAAMPRVVEAWLQGDRLTPEDGSPAYETTEVVLVLDPPIAEQPLEKLRAELAALEEELDCTGFRDGTLRRGWVFAKNRGSRGTVGHPGVKIYPPPTASDSSSVG
jgi:hypothetical protein